MLRRLLRARIARGTVRAYFRVLQGGHLESADGDRVRGAVLHGVESPLL
jgi:hypothetical protein